MECLALFCYREREQVTCFVEVRLEALLRQFRNGLSDTTTCEGNLLLILTRPGVVFSWNMLCTLKHNITSVLLGIHMHDASDWKKIVIAVP